MYKPFLHILFYFLPAAVRAQENLVPNPSFEDTVSCPLGLSDVLNSSVSWYSPTGGSPDLHHICQTDPITGVGVPQNVFGWQWPRTGVAYAGFHFSSFNFGSNGREYIQCELIEPLENGQRYVIDFYVSLGESSNKASNLGALLSSNPVSSNDAGVLPYVPQVVSPPDQPIVDTLNWVQIIDTITADGGERYLTIGLFTDDVNTYWIWVNGGNRDEPYYYIDDVSVTRFDTVEVIPSENPIIPNVFTPNDDNVNDSFQVSNMDSFSGELLIYNRWGRMIHSTDGTALEWDGNLKSGMANAGVYYYVLRLQNMNNYRIVKKGFVQLLR